MQETDATSSSRPLFNPGRKAWLNTLLVLVLLFPFWWWAAHRYKSNLLSNQRSMISIELTILEKSLESLLSRRLAMLEALRSFIAAEQRLTPQEFANDFHVFASGLSVRATGIQFLSFAPEGMQQHVFPLVGNEAVLGQDLLKDKSGLGQLAAATDQIIVGPIENYTDGHPAVRMLVSVRTETNFIGLAVILNDVSALLDTAGISDVSTNLNLALRDRSGQFFYGNSRILDSDPIIRRVEIGNSHWELMVIPAGGWEATIWYSWRIFLINSVLIAGLLGTIVFLVSTRQAQLTVAVQERTRELSLTSNALEQETIERNKAEELLRLVESAVHEADESILITTADLDSPGPTIVFVNPGFTRMTGYTSEEVVGKTPRILQGPKTDQSVLLRLRQELPEGKSFRGETTNYRKDGTPFILEWGVAPIRDKQGNITHYVAVQRDITARKNAEAVLRQQANLLDLAYNTIIVRDMEDKIVFWNRGAEELYGWSKEDAAGQSAHKLLKTKFSTPIEKINSQLFSQGRWAGEMIHSRRDGTEVIVASRWAVQKNEKDEPTAILEINNEITQRKRAEDEIRKLNQELEKRVTERTEELKRRVTEVELLNSSMINLLEDLQIAQRKAEESTCQLKEANERLHYANNELEAFSYSVSHDLRAPLRSIQGFSEMLLEDAADQLSLEHNDLLRRLYTAAGRMDALINSLLTLSRVSRVELRYEKINLSELAQWIARDLKASNPARTVDFIIQPDLIVQGDSQMLNIVLENLLNNAWKYTGATDNPRIEVGSLRQNDHEVFFVRDNGAGFDMTYGDRLFQPFQRLHPSSEFEGTGVGLATVHRIIKRHNGSIWAKAQINKGATFYFTLN